MSSKAVTITDYRKETPGGIAADGITWEFPPVATVNAHGKAQQWQIAVRIFTGAATLPVPDSAFVPLADGYFRGRLPAGTYGYHFTRSGVVGGKIRDIVPTIVLAGKNIGKTNETNPFTQALRDAIGIYNKQLRKAAGAGGSGGAGNASGAMPEMYPPMLAQILKDQKKPPIPNEARPLYVQRKFNGVRAVAVLVGGANGASGTTYMYSRRMKPYLGLAVIKSQCAELLRDHPGVYLDGEVYAHGVALQDISGYVRREDSADDPRFKYHVYDCFIPARAEMKYSERRQLLDSILSVLVPIHDRVVAVETFTAPSMADCERYYRQFLAEGYEGAMVRVDSPYEYSANERHSKQLLKMKPTYDAEYEIVGWTTGEKGKAAAALMIICTANDKEFPVTPTGEIEQRNALARKFAEVEQNGRTHFENQWKGCQVTVYYDELSKDGLPQRARTALEIRTAD